MRADSINVNSGKFGAVDRTDLASPIIRDYRQEVLRQSDDTDTAITLTVAQSGALVLFDENEAYAITMPAVTLDDVGITYSFMETIASDTDRNINTAYDNDYFVGSLVVLPSAVWDAGTAQDGLAANIVANAGSDVQLTFDDNLANGAGGVGSIVNLTAVVTGNTGAGGGAKLVWAVTGQMFTADPNGNGTAIFT